MSDNSAHEKWDELIDKIEELALAKAVEQMADEFIAVEKTSELYQELKRKHPNKAPALVMCLMMEAIACGDIVPTRTIAEDDEYCEEVLKIDVCDDEFFVILAPDPVAIGVFRPQNPNYIFTATPGAYQRNPE